MTLRLTLEREERRSPAAVAAREVEAIRTMVTMAGVTAKPGLRRACYRAAGQHLVRLRYGRTGPDWLRLVELAGLGRRRAYQLMAVASGAKSLDDLRAEHAQREKLRRAKSLGGARTGREGVQAGQRSPPRR